MTVPASGRYEILDTLGEGGMGLLSAGTSGRCEVAQGR